MCTTGVAVQYTMDTYDERVDPLIPGHGVEIATLLERGILVDDKPTELPPQTLSASQREASLFRFIERKGDQAFGGGKWKARSTTWSMFPAR